MPSTGWASQRFCHARAVHWLFVYGTLMPGRLRWPYVADVVTQRRPGVVAGTLYDTGSGYPALVLAGTGRVEGWLLGVADDRAGDVMDMLDEVEGPDYRRAPTTTDDGTEAVTYEYVGPVAAFAELATGRWDSREER